jgi:hypothetical protein
MKLFTAILIGFFALWFCELSAYRFWTKYASRKNQILKSCQFDNELLYRYGSWIPFDAWSLPPEFSPEASPFSFERLESEHSKAALSYLRPFRDELYDSFWTDRMERPNSIVRVPVPGGILLRSSPASAGNRPVVLTLTGADGISMGGDFNELSIESSRFLDHGVDFALASVSNFASVLEVVSFLVGSEWDETRSVAVCAYGTQADLLALAMAHRPQLFSAVAILSPIGDFPVDRFQNAEYPAVLLAARSSDEESIKTNALLWTATCRRLSSSNRSRVFCVIAPTNRQEAFSDVKLKSLSYAFLIDSLTGSHTN